MAQRLRATAALGLLSVALLACSDDAFPPPNDAAIDPVGDSRVADARRDGEAERDGAGCSLTVVTINGTPVASVNQIGPQLDRDAARNGIQLDVEVRASGAPTGRAISLGVTGLDPAPQADLATGSLASFFGVTISDEVRLLDLAPRAAGCRGEVVRLNVQHQPRCLIAQPAAGAILTTADDRINRAPGTGTFDGTFNYDVIVTTEHAASGSAVALSIGSAAQQSVVTDASQEAHFGVVLSPGRNTLRATVSAGGLLGTCEAEASVVVSGPVCNIVGFSGGAVATAQLGAGLGPAQDLNGDVGDGVQTALRVETDSTAGSIVLQSGGVSLATLTPSDGHASFPLDLTAEQSYFFRAICRNATNGNASESPGFKAFVDLTPPPAVTDLACRVASGRRGLLDCDWTSVQDQGSGVTKYLVRYRPNGPLDAASFDGPSTLALSPDPDAVPIGEQQRVGLSGLSLGTPYAVAVKAIDAVGNVSPLSNLPPASLVDFRLQELRGSTGSKFGTPIAVGDFNCDGFTDMAVGLFEATVDGLSKAGEVQLYFSNGTNFPGTFSKRISGTQANGGFGVLLSALDYDGDHCSDLAVKASGHGGGRGQVYLYRGRPFWNSDRADVGDGIGAEIIFHLPSAAAATERLAIGLGAADLDGDGRDDLAMSHWITDGPRWSTVALAYGEADVPLMEGSLAPRQRELPADADLLLSGGSFGGLFGGRIVRGGRLNDDRFGDLLIAASTEQEEGVQRGALYVLLGAARGTPPEQLALTDANRVLRIGGSAAEGNSLFGRLLSAVGDVDGDGVNEFAASDPLLGGGAGAVYLFSLQPSVPTSVAQAEAVIRSDLVPAANNNFGIWMAEGIVPGHPNGVDLNGDGLADLLVGMVREGATAVGSARLFFGSRAGLAGRLASNADRVFRPVSGGTTGFSNPNTFLGDINGDGFPDLVIGEWTYDSNRGRIFVYY
ncbi:MAG: FG-GAP repeat protein [Proteobacteria bacterium]|nr:FG-GAP repeat protein [Pseudomonadota bacterium]